MKAARILIIEDEQLQRESLAETLQMEGYHAATAVDAADGLYQVSAERFDVVITDYQLPDQTGLDILRAVKKVNPEIEVIMMTAYGTIDRAVTVMKEGAFDYLTKPVNMDELLVILQRACAHQALVTENIRLRRDLDERFSVSGVVAHSRSMQEALNLAGRAAPSDASILLSGESGTGKEVLARVVHQASYRKDKPFVAFNAAALPPTLVESELFGHEKGAFTGAEKQREGLFAQADGGTLFMDEIGDLPLEMQSKFLRALQEQTIMRLGGSQPITVDIRVIAATNRDIDAMIRDQQFREDLYYRFNVITIVIPPLRERRDDIMPLTEFFLQRMAEKNRKNISGLTREARDLLVRYDFPGNVRELENILEHAVVLSRNAELGVEDFPPKVGQTPSSGVAKGDGGLDDQVQDLEKQLIVQALQDSGGNQTAAADSLHISERKLRYKIQKYGL
jgi:DNA-binding NtrC family response regulator